jgi:hypothetical protein
VPLETPPSSIPTTRRRDHRSRITMCNYKHTANEYYIKTTLKISAYRPHPSVKSTARSSCWKMVHHGFPTPRDPCTNHYTFLNGWLHVIPGDRKSCLSPLRPSQVVVGEVVADDIPP